jgi:hypothetical protein
MSYEKLSPAEEMKLIIIENYIDWYTSDDEERELMKEGAVSYVLEDHCNELSEILFTKKPINK